MNYMVKLWDKICALEKFQEKNTLPEEPGVYFFLDAKKKLLYIGKAASLRDRAQSYFSRDVSDTRGPKIKLMLELVGFVAYKKTDSVLEALIFETNLIKRYQPLYNTDAKDDKSFNYVVITKERFPRVLLVRGKEIENKLTKLDSRLRGNDKYRIKYQFGPFPHGMQLREAMKIVRKIFPFRDKCLPAESFFLAEKAGVLSKKTKPPKLCFSAQIGLCPGICAGAITAREYQRTINHIRLFFEGRKNQLVKKLESEMKIFAKRLEFEKANEIKKTLFALKHIQDVALIKNELRIMNHEFLPAFGRREIKIEAYDVAHLGGNSSVGVTVAVQDGKLMKEAYKKFILRKKHSGNDLTALQEVLERRFKHTEWTLPDIVVVDGAELQIGAAKQVLIASRLEIPIVGVVKDIRHKPERIIGPQALIKRFQKDILLANNEAHRFAITFHRQRRRKEFL
jgi:excinuclease ABC subunit C